MKERGILYTPDNIRAIGEGRKTQTRRIMKPQPVMMDGRYKWSCRAAQTMVDVEDVLKAKDPTWEGFAGSVCPYGAVGDRLYVKEGVAFVQIFDIPTGTKIRDEVIYRMENPTYEADWRSPLFMPKWAARLWLEITDVRVERLQDISEADAIAEGVKKVKDACYVIPGFGYDLSGLCHSSPITPYAQLWDSINEKDGHGWAVNEWVWVLTFKVIEP